MAFRICKWLKMCFRRLCGFISCKNEVVNKNFKFG